MQLTVDYLSKAGGFTGGPVKRQVTYHGVINPEAVEKGEPPEFGDVVADVWIRPMSYHTAVKDVSAYQSGADIVAHRLAACVCHEDGSPVFQVSDITGVNDDGEPVMVKGPDGNLIERGPLNKTISDALMTLVSEVSGLGKTKAS